VLDERTTLTPVVPTLSIPADADPVLLGRGSKCDVRFRNHAVSRQHAQLRRCEDRWYVLDLGSTNGTHLNGRQLDAGFAFPGDELQLADLRVVLPQL
jgi:pSer/pThr/pTyr-binding forkhead associated (FHA) protein